MSMTYRQQTPHRQPDPNNDVGILVVFGGLGAIVLGFAALAGSVAAAISAGVYIVLAGSLLLGLRKEPPGSFRIAFFVLLASGAVAAVAPILVFDWKLFTWTVAEIAVAALYAASLVLGLFAALRTFWRGLAVALALALAAVVVYVPVPKGGEAEDEASASRSRCRTRRGGPCPARSSPAPSPLPGATAWRSISTMHTSPTSLAMSNPGNSTRIAGSKP